VAPPVISKRYSLSVAEVGSTLGIVRLYNMPKLTVE